MTRLSRPPIPRAQRSCIICQGNGWQSPYAVPARADAKRGDLIAIWSPCSQCWDTVPVPDKIEIPVRGGRPIYGTHWTWNVDVCLAGNPAINERCGDLLCVCAPTIVPSVSRVWRIDNRDPKPEHDGVFYATDDDGKRFILTPMHTGRMLLRIPKDGWGLVGVPRFPLTQMQARSENGP